MFEIVENQCDSIKKHFFRQQFLDRIFSPGFTVPPRTSKGSVLTPGHEENKKTAFPDLHKGSATHNREDCVSPRSKESGPRFSGIFPSRGP